MYIYAYPSAHVDTNMYNTYTTYTQTHTKTWTYAIYLMDSQHFAKTTLGQADMTMIFDNNNKDYNTYKMPSIRLGT